MKSINGQMDEPTKVITKMRPKLRQTASLPSVVTKGSMLSGYIYIKNLNDLSKDYQGIHEKEYIFTRSRGHGLCINVRV